MLVDAIWKVFCEGHFRIFRFCFIALIQVIRGSSSHQEKDKSAGFRFVNSG